MVRPVESEHLKIKSKSRVDRRKSRVDRRKSRVDRRKVFGLRPGRGGHRTDRGRP